MKKNELKSMEVMDFLNTISTCDGIWTDPPYPMDMWDIEDEKYQLLNRENLVRVMTRCREVLKNGAPLFWMSNLNNLRFTWAALEKCKFRILNVIVWNKAPSGFSGWIAPGSHFLQSNEFVFYCCKDTETLPVINNRFNYYGKSPDPKYGATTKPSGLVAHCLQPFDSEDAVFVDPFAGSNPLLRAINQGLLLGGSITNAFVTGDDDPAQYSPNPEEGLQKWIQ